MGQEAIDKVLEARRAAVTLATTAAEGDKFYSILVGEGLQEHFLELQFRIGLKTCFSYTDLQWFNYDPDAGCIDLEFGGFLVTLKGRGLGDRLFHGLKQKRVAWVKEADTDMQDHKGNETFIEEIGITPPREEVAPTE
jgi:hypothetical protein